MTHPPATVRDLRAARDTLPVALSIAPFGLVIGATATQLGVPPPADMAAAATVFAGAAHFAPLTMFAAGAGVLAALGTAVLINARLLLYSAALEPRFRGQPRWFRWFGPALLIDQTYLMVLARDDLEDPARFRRYWLVSGGSLLASWVAMVGIGGVLFLVAATVGGFDPAALTPFALAFSAGSFLHVAVTDLLPDLHRAGAEKRGLILALLGGLGLMLALMRLVPE